MRLLDRLRVLLLITGAVTFYGKLGYVDPDTQTTEVISGEATLGFRRFRNNFRK